MTNNPQLTPDNDQRANVERADDRWTDCPAGEVGALVGQLQTRRQSLRRRQTLQQAAMGVSSLVVLIALGLFTIPQLMSSEPNYGGIVCSDVQRHTDRFLMGELDEGTSAQIENHLEDCLPCRQFVDNRRQELSPAPPQPTETVLGSPAHPADDVGLQSLMASAAD